MHVSITLLCIVWFELQTCEVQVMHKFAFEICVKYDFLLFLGRKIVGWKSVGKFSGSFGVKANFKVEDRKIEAFSNEEGGYAQISERGRRGPAIWGSVGESLVRNLAKSVRSANFQCKTGGCLMIFYRKALLRGFWRNLEGFWRNRGQSERGLSVGLV